MHTAILTEPFTGITDHTLNGQGGKRIGQVVCRTGGGLEVPGELLRMTRFTAAFEVFIPEMVLQTSEVFEHFRIVCEERTIYSGGAVVRSLANVGSALVCEANLQEQCWSEPVDALAQQTRKQVRQGFEGFLRGWEGFYKILPEFKTAVADLQSFLEALRLWLGQVEAGFAPGGGRAVQERETLEELRSTVIPAVAGMFERFEYAATMVPADLVPLHQAFCRRLLHPLLLCCPFMNRIYSKPLGYAGDFEMMNMIWRHAPEGDSLYAKLLQCFILDQAPAAAVRNRVDYFVKQFVLEADRVAATGRRSNFCSIGCGPAREVENFMVEHDLSNQTRFQLLDFNDETLQFTGGRLDGVRAANHRRTAIELVKKPAQLLLKESGSSALGQERYDLIYCSGLYDYLNDRVIKALNTRLYDRLRPGGILIVTNFDPYNPIRHIMEFIFDWFLIHRDGNGLAGLAPGQAGAELSSVRAEHSGCNIFLETRKPL